MGQMRKDAGAGSLVRCTNSSDWINVEEDADYNVASIAGDAIAALIAAGTAFTLVNRAPMAPGTLALTFATDATVATRVLDIEVRGYDADGHLRSELVSFSQAASTTTVKQTANGFIWIESIKPVRQVIADTGDTLVIGFTNIDANSNPGAGLIVPGSAKSTDEFVAQYTDAYTDPPKLAVAETAYSASRRLFYPEFRTGNRSYRFVLHPDRC